jgi:beta-galactosidase
MAIKFKGMCIQLGPIGTAVKLQATERQLVMMKEMGPMPFVPRIIHHHWNYLKICDSIGPYGSSGSLYEWKKKKNTNGYGDFLMNGPKKI